MNVKLSRLQKSRCNPVPTNLEKGVFPIMDSHFHCCHRRIEPLLIAENHEAFEDFLSKV